jgi:hypothetical protein
VMDLPELWHSADELRDVAYGRGLDDQDVAEVAFVWCSRCGITADAPVAFAAVCGGFVHFPDCSGSEQHIRFIRRRT